MTLSAARQLASLAQACRALLLAALALAPGLGMAQAVRPPAPPPPAPTALPDLPEYRVKALPTDTFRPSEEVSEDHPVPFPADI